MKAIIEAETMDELEAVFCAASLLLKRPDEEPKYRRIYRFPVIQNTDRRLPQNPSPSAMPAWGEIEVETMLYCLADEDDGVKAHFGFRCRKRPTDEEPEPDKLPTEIPRDEFEQLMRDNPGFTLFVQSYIQKNGPLQESQPGLIVLDEMLGFMTALVTDAMENRRS